MTIQTTTLPAANPVRLGSQPIRRRALVPRVAVEVAGPPEPEEQQEQEQPEQPETDVTLASGASDDDVTGHDEDSAPETAAPEAAAPVEPPRRGRGRPRKDVVDVIAQGRPQYDDAAYARLRASSANVTHTPDSVQTIPDVVATEHDVTKLGYAVVQAAKCGLPLEKYIVTIRGIIVAYDRLYGTE